MSNHELSWILFHSTNDKKNLQILLDPLKTQALKKSCQLKVLKHAETECFIGTGDMSMILAPSSIVGCYSSYRPAGL